MHRLATKPEIYIPIFLEPSERTLEYISMFVEKGMKEDCFIELELPRDVCFSSKHIRIHSFVVTNRYRLIGGKSLALTDLRTEETVRFELCKFAADNIDAETLPRQEKAYIEFDQPWCLLAKDYYAARHRRVGTTRMYPIVGAVVSKIP